MFFQEQFVTFQGKFFSKGVIVMRFCTKGNEEYAIFFLAYGICAKIRYAISETNYTAWSF